MTNDLQGVETAPRRRRHQCITIEAESVVINGAEFDAMTAEIISLRADVDRDKNRECANAWHAVWARLMEIDPSMHQRKGSGLASALDFINELASRPKP